MSIDKLQDSERERRAEKARAMRYKRPSCRGMAYFEIQNGLYEMAEVCDEVTYSMPDDWETLSELIGDDAEAQEFRFMFSDLTADIEKFQEGLDDAERLCDSMDVEYDDCTVALLGPSYDHRGEWHDELYGFDTFYRDYYDLAYYQAEYAGQESEKRLMRLTKKDLLRTISTSMRIMVGYWELRERYEALYASMDLVRGTNKERLEMVTQINKLYERANEVDFSKFASATKEFDNFLSHLPQQMFVE